MSEAQRARWKTWHPLLQEAAEGRQLWLPQWAKHHPRGRPPSLPACARPSCARLLRGGGPTCCRCVAGRTAASARARGDRGTIPAAVHQMYVARVRKKCFVTDPPWASAIGHESSMGMAAYQTVAKRIHECTADLARTGRSLCTVGRREGGNWHAGRSWLRAAACTMRRGRGPLQRGASARRCVLTHARPVAPRLGPASLEK